MLDNTTKLLKQKFSCIIGTMKKYIFSTNLLNPNYLLLSSTSFWHNTVYFCLILFQQLSMYTLNIFSQYYRSILAQKKLEKNWKYSLFRSNISIKLELRPMKFWYGHNTYRFFVCNVCKSKYIECNVFRFALKTHCNYFLMQI